MQKVLTSPLAFAGTNHISCTQEKKSTAKQSSYVSQSQNIHCNLSIMLNTSTSSTMWTCFWKTIPKNSLILRLIGCGRRLLAAEEVCFLTPHNRNCCHTENCFRFSTNAFMLFYEPVSSEVFFRVNHTQPQSQKKIYTPSAPLKVAKPISTPLPENLSNEPFNRATTAPRINRQVFGSSTIGDTDLGKLPPGHERTFWTTCLAAQKKWEMCMPELFNKKNNGSL